MKVTKNIQSNNFSQAQCATVSQCGASASGFSGIDIGINCSSQGAGFSECEVNGWVGDFLSRLGRLFKSNADAALDAAEDARKIIKSTLREMQTEIPKRKAELNRLGGMVRTAGDEVKSIESEIGALKDSARDALKLGNEASAAQLMNTVAEKEGALGVAAGEYQRLDGQYQKAIQNFEIYQASQKATITKYEAILSRSEFAELNGKMARSMENSEVGDHSQTLNEMRKKLGIETNTNEIAAEQAMSGTNGLMASTALNKQKARGAELLAALKAEG